MNPETGLLRTIAREPEDDAPRLVYADWLEEHGQTERADFIRAQIELATLTEDSPRRRELAFRARELLDRHEDEWVAPLRPWAHDWRFSRGFVEKLGLKAAELEERAEVLFVTCPVRRLWVTELGSAVEPLSHIPAYHQLTGLDLCGNDLDTDALRRQARFGHLRGLRTLGLMFNRIDDEGARLLREEPFFQGLSLIRCGANPISVEERLRLQGHFGDRMTFTCERDADHLYAFQDDWFTAGFGEGYTQILALATCSATYTATWAAIFDPEGNLLDIQQRDLPHLESSPWAERSQRAWEEHRALWKKELGFRPTTIKVKRFPFGDEEGVYDFPGGWMEVFNQANHPDLADSREWLDRWLVDGKFVFDWGSRGGGVWLNRTGEVTDT